MLNPIEEAKFNELQNKCKSLKVMPPPSIHIGFKVHKDGKLIFDDKQRGHSWTRNFYNMRCGLGAGAVVDGNTFGAGYMTGIEIGGSMGYGGNITSIDGGIAVGTVGTESVGIVVGTSDTAWNIDQYALGAIITSGSGAGQLAYQVSGYDSKLYASKIWTTTNKRVMNNNSGGDIIVKEVGLYGRNYDSAAMLERSVLDPTVTVPNGTQLTVTYEISMNFSAID